PVGVTGGAQWLAYQVMPAEVNCRVEVICAQSVPGTCGLSVLLLRKLSAVPTCPATLLDESELFKYCVTSAVTVLVWPGSWPMIAESAAPLHQPRKPQPFTSIQVTTGVTLLICSMLPSHGETPMSIEMFPCTSTVGLTRPGNETSSSPE